MTFAPKFYADLEDMSDDDTLRALPPYEWHKPAEGMIPGEPIAFLACDLDYYRDFAVPMLRSLDTVAPNARVHVHLMMCDRSAIPDAPMPVNMTVEYMEIADKRTASVRRAYYHAIRFVRMWQLAKAYACPMWLMDVDALFRNDPAAMFSLLAGGVAFRARPGRLESWNQYNASVVGISGDDVSLRWLRLIAGFITNAWKLNQLSWGIDQLAMYGAYWYLRDCGCALDVLCLGDRAVDYDYNDDGVVWQNSGQKNLGEDRAKYAALFEGYATWHSERST